MVWVPVLDLSTCTNEFSRTYSGFSNKRKFAYVKEKLSIVYLPENHQSGSVCGVSHGGLTPDQTPTMHSTIVDYDNKDNL